MIKFTDMQENGRTRLTIGLSFGNLKKFKEGPLDSMIRIDGSEMGLPIDVVIFSGRTEQDMMRLFADAIGPETKVEVDPKLADG